MNQNLLFLVDGSLGIGLLFRKYVLPLAIHHGSRVYVAPLDEDGEKALQRLIELNHKALEARKQCIPLERIDASDINALRSSMLMVICPLRRRYRKKRKDIVAALPYPKIFVHLSGMGRLGINRVLISTVGTNAYFKDAILKLWLSSLKPKVVACHIAMETRKSFTSLFSLGEVPQWKAMVESKKAMEPIKKELEGAGVYYDEKYIRSNKVGLALSVEAVVEKADAILIGEDSSSPLLLDRPPYNDLLTYAPCDIIIMKN